MVVDNSEVRSRIITELNGNTFRGDGSKENPLAQIVEQENIYEIITKVMIYASFFQAAMFFNYRGVIAHYDSKSREFLLETDRGNILKEAVQDLFEGKDSMPTITESNPLLRIIK